MSYQLQPFHGSWAAAAPGDCLAIVAGYDELLDTVDRWRIELGFTLDEAEELCGLTKAHLSKIIGPARSKILGRFSHGAVMNGMGLRLAVIVADKPIPLTPRNETRLPFAMRSHNRFGTPVPATQGV